MNVDGAQQCLDRAKAALRGKDVPKAMRLLQKSIRLHALPEAERLLASLQAQASAPAPAPAAAGRPETSTPPAAASTGRRGGGADASTTQRILAARDLYEVLGLARGASGAQVKKAYRKVRATGVSSGWPRGLVRFPLHKPLPHPTLVLQLALKYHPDKNKSPGADEVFKSECCAAFWDVLVHRERGPVSTGVPLCAQRWDTPSPC